MKINITKIRLVHTKCTTLKKFNKLTQLKFFVPHFICDALRIAPAQ